MANSIDEQTRNLIYKMSDAFFSMFSAYNPSIVEQAMKMLSKEENKIINLFYGLDGEHCLDYDELADKFELSVDEVDEIIENGVEKLKNALKNKTYKLKEVNKYSDLVEKYGTDKVICAIEQLDEEHKNLIKEYYVDGRGITLEKLGKKYNLNAGSVYTRLNTGIKKISEMIENKMANIFYSKFEGFSKEEVDEKLNEIDNTSKQMIKFYYGLNCSRKSVNELSGIYHMSGQNVYYIINKSIETMLKNLTNKNDQARVGKKRRNKEDFYSIFGDFTVEQVNDAMKYINEKQKNMLVLYFGLNGEECKSTKEIGKILGYTVASVRNTVPRLVEKIVEILNGNKEYKIYSLYDKFEGFNKEEIDGALLKLEEKDQEIIRLYYGLDCEKCSMREISEKFSCSLSAIRSKIIKSENKIKNYLDPNYKEKEVKTKKVRDYKKKEVELVEEPKIKEKEASYREGNNKWLYEYLASGDKEAYTKLIEKNMKLVYHMVNKYCKNPQEYDEYVSIATMGLLKAVQTFKTEKLGEVNFATYATICIRNEIFMEFRNKRRDAKVDFFGDIVYGDEESLSLEDSLASEDDFVEDMLEKENENYKKEKINEVLDSLDKRDRAVIEYFYGFKTGKKLTQQEVAKILGISRSYVCRLLDKVKKILEKELADLKTDYVFGKDKISNQKDNKPLDVKLSKKDVLYKKEDKSRVKHRSADDFYSKFEGFTVEQINEAMENFSVKQRNLLILYYGLNGEEAKSTKEIGEILGYKTISVNNTVPLLNKKIKEILINPDEHRVVSFYDKFEGYSKEEVDSVFSKLKERDQEIIKLYYGLGCEKCKQKVIAEKYDTTSHYVSVIIKNNVDKIRRYLTFGNEEIVDNSWKRDKSSKKEKFYNKFSGFSVEEIDAALSRLETRDKEIVCLNYGINCNRCTQKEIADKFGLSKNYVGIVIKKSEDKISKYLNYGYEKETTKKVKETKKKEVNLVEKPKEKELNYREGNNKWLYEYLVNGNQEAYSKLVEKNMKLVHYMVQKYCKNPSEHEEYISIGCGGLLEAINTFDVEKIGKIQFATYAAVCIRNDIFMEFRNRKKDAVVDMFSDHIYGEDEDLTLEDTLASDEDFVEDMLEDENFNNKKKRIYEVLNSLDKRDKAVIEYLYGFKTGSPLTQVEVAEIFGLSQSYIARLSNSIEKILAEKLEDLKEEYVFSHEKDPNIQRMNDAFYSMFKGEDKKEVKKLLSKFRNKEYVYLYYGLDGNTCLDYDEIAYKFNVGIDEVDSKIESVINKLKKFYEGRKIEETYDRVNLYRELIENYGIDRVNVALQNFADKQKDMTLDYYLHDLSIEEMIKKYNKTKNYIYTEVVRCVKKMEKYIQKDLLTREEKFYELYEGYSRIEVNKALNSLSDKEKEIISSNYNLNGKYLSGTQLAEKYNISPSYIALYIMNLTIKIGGLLEENKEENKVLNKNDFYNKFKGYSEIQVDSALLELLEKDRELLNLYYGLKGESHTVTYICKKLDIDKKDVYERIYKDISNLRGLLKNDKRVRREKGREKKKVYEELASLYGKDAVLIALSKFSEEKQETFKDYYGIGRKALGRQEIIDKYGIAINTVYQRIDTMGKKIKKYLENPSGDINLSRRHKFDQAFSKYDFKEVLKLINMFDDKTRDCMLYYYDLMEESISKEELYEKYKIKGSGSMYTFVTRGTDKVLSVLAGDSKAINKKSGFYGAFVGYTKTQVNQAVDMLKAKDREFIKLYYGIGNSKKMDASQLTEKYGVTRQRVYSKKDAIIEKIAVILESQNFESKKDEFYKMFEGVEKAKVDEALNKLSSMEKDCISLYYGLDGEVLTFKQIAAKYGYNPSSIYTKNKVSIDKIKQLIENPNSFLDKKSEFYNNFDSYSKEDVDLAMSKLSKQDQGILSLYFGFKGNPMSQKDIAKYYNLNTNYISVKIKRSIKNILSLLENPELNLEDKKEIDYQKSLLDNRIKKFNILLEKYGKDKVNEEIFKLRDRDKGIICDYFGIDCEPLSVKEIANKYTIKNSYVSTSAFQILGKIENHLEHPENFISHKEKFYERFKGYNEEEVKHVLSLLKPKYQELIKLYYGLDGDRKNATELSEIYGYKQGSNITQLIYKNLNKMLKKLGENSDDFYDLFEGYTKEEIDRVLLTLSKKHVGMIKDYYGIDCDRLTQKEIFEKYEVASSTYVSYCIRKGIKEIKRKLSNPQDINHVNKFYYIFDGYNKEQVDLAIEKLDDRSKKILYMMYGFEKDRMSYKEIGNELGLTVPQVTCFRKNAINKIKDILEGKDIVKNRNSKFEELIKTYGEGLVLEKMKELSESEKAFLIMYYTLGKVKKYELYEIAEKINVNEDMFGVLEDKILEKLVNLLNIKYKAKVIKEKRIEFLDKIKHKTYLKEAIEALTKGDRQILGLYYGLNGKDIISIEELCEKTNLSKEEILLRIENIVSKINRYIPSSKR